MNVKLMKMLDAGIGFISASICPPPVYRALPSLVTSMLLIRPGGIGDAALLAPVIQSIKKSYPTLHLTVLAEQRNSGVFSLISGVDRLLCYDRPTEFMQVLRGNYDAVIDSEQWHRLSAVVARFASSAVKIGFDTNERRRMFTHPVAYSHDDYEMLSFYHLLEPLRIDTTEAAMLEIPFLSVPETASYKAAGLLKSLESRQFVVIFPGASIPERRWGGARFRLVAEMLSVFGIMVVVVGGAEDRLQGETIVAGVGGLNLAGQTSMAETAAVIDRSALLLSGDSGILHIAVGLGKPTVSLFGPGRAKKWAPRGKRHVVLNKELPCSPCTTYGSTPACPVQARCMQEISVEEVGNAVSMLLTQEGGLSPQCCKRDWIEVTWQQ